MKMLVIGATAAAAALAGCTDPETGQPIGFWDPTAQAPQVSQPFAATGTNGLQSGNVIFTQTEGADNPFNIQFPNGETFFFDEANVQLGDLAGNPFYYMDDSTDRVRFSGLQVYDTSGNMEKENVAAGVGVTETLNTGIDGVQYDAFLVSGLLSNNLPENGSYTYSGLWHGYGYSGGDRLFTYTQPAQIDINYGQRELDVWLVGDATTPQFWAQDLPLGDDARFSGEVKGDFPSNPANTFTGNLQGGVFGTDQGNGIDAAAGVFNATNDSDPDFIVGGGFAAQF